MERVAEVLIPAAALASLALAAYVGYAWRRRSRVRRAEGWVRDYLMARYGGLPDRLSIDCSADPLWPVLVNFTEQQTGARRHLRFSWAGGAAPPELTSEREPRP